MRKPTIEELVNFVKASLAEQLMPQALVHTIFRSREFSVAAMLEGPRNVLERAGSEMMADFTTEKATGRFKGHDITFNVKVVDFVSATCDCGEHARIHVEMKGVNKP